VKGLRESLEWSLARGFPPNIGSPPSSSIFPKAPLPRPTALTPTMGGPMMLLLLTREVWAYPPTFRHRRFRRGHWRLMKSTFSSSGPSIQGDDDESPVTTAIITITIIPSLQKKLNLFLAPSIDDAIIPRHGLEYDQRPRRCHYCTESRLPPCIAVRRRGDTDAPE
jgi:hypothetical protein